MSGSHSYNNCRNATGWLNEVAFHFFEAERYRSRFSKLTMRCRIWMTSITNSYALNALLLSEVFGHFTTPSNRSRSPLAAFSL